MLSVLLLLVIAMLSLSMSRAFRAGAIRTGSKWALRAESSSTGRINKGIKLDVEKVVDTLSLKAGEKAVLCRCWLSSKYPYCDGTHAKHNKETGDNVGPVIVNVEK